MKKKQSSFFSSLNGRERAILWHPEFGKYIQAREDSFLLESILHTVAGIKPPCKLLTLGNFDQSFLIALDHFATLLAAELEYSNIHSDNNAWDVLVVSSADDLSRIDPSTLNAGGHLFSKVRISPQIRTKLRLDHVFALPGCAVYRTPCSACPPGKIHVIIPVFNRVSLTLRCLESLFSQQLHPHLNVVLVDDGSSDGTAKQVNSRYPSVTILVGDGSLWWGGACLMAMEYIATTIDDDDCILLLNNDVSLPGEALMTLVQNHNVDRGSCVSLLGVSDKRLEASGDLGHDLYRLGRGLRHAVQHEARIPVHALFGRCTLMPADILKRVSPIDAAVFPHYYADTDYTLRAAKAGYSMFVIASHYIDTVHDVENTGIHYDFFDLDRSLSEIWTYLTSRRSLGHLGAMIRFNIRHYPDKLLSTILSHLRKVFAQHRFVGRFIKAPPREPYI